jgi:transcriptional regulator with XRE-family HTH domain
MDEAAKQGAALAKARKAQGWSQAVLAERARAFAHDADEEFKLSQQLIGQFESGITKKVPRWVKYAKQALQAAVDGVEILPDLPPSDAGTEYLEVDVLPTFGGMGGGGTGEGEATLALLPRVLVEDQLRGKPKDFLLIEVRGDSMIPEFLHGDQILIDRRDVNPRQPGPFALFDGDGIVIKLVERIPGRRDHYRIFSANARYSEYEVQEESVRILGRPVWFARRL